MKKLAIIGGIIGLLVVAGVVYFNSIVKSKSPEADVNFESGDLKIHVFYNRPSKRGRIIFGELVPYGKVWRTGANEATIFETNKDLIIKDKTLKAGKYTLWTIPQEQSWTIIFNSEVGQWGIDYNGVANRDPKNDVLSVEVPAVIQEKEFEQFTISVEKVDEDQELILLWDKTLVSVPLMVAQ